MIRASRRPLRGAREQVAAVCYRIYDSRLEFLLVKTRRGGRWIFPKGGVERGMTRSQSAALEALEEAGVHGSIEEAPFVQYEAQERKRLTATGAKINAYLCAVAWLGVPCEGNRTPTWFSPAKAMRRLSQGRERVFAQDLCRVVDRAVIRIERLLSCGGAGHETLRRVEMEVRAMPRQVVWQPVLVGRSMTHLSHSFRQEGTGVKALNGGRRVLQLGPAADAIREMRFASKPEDLSRPQSQGKTEHNSRFPRNILLATLINPSFP